MIKKTWLLWGAVCLILFASPAHSVIDRVTVAPAEFHPIDGAAQQLIGKAGGDYVYRSVSSTTDEFYAQVHLPHGAIIKYVRLHYLDNDLSYGMSIALVRANKYTGATDSLYMLLTSGASSSIQYLDDFSAFPAPSYALTNTDACNYQIWLWMGGKGEDSQRFYGVTVVYEY